MKLTIETKEGEFVAHYSEHGLAQLDFPTTAKTRRHPAAHKTEIPAHVHAWHKLTIRALHDALAGRTPRELPPLDMASGTDFQRRVWSALRRITTGHTKSYAEIAAEVGKPKAARAVGGACGANPIPVLVPCHRVLAANHHIGGFSGGIEWKRTLLARETAAVF